MFKDLTPTALYMGLLAAFVGYAASFAIVLAGLSAVGATSAQATTGLFMAAVSMGVCSIWLPAVTKTPSAVAWSTPGAAFLAASTTLPGGFGEAIGAMVVCAVLIILTGFIPQLGRMVAAIPKPIANALLAGVILKLCFAPAMALGTIPFLVIPVLAAWLVGMLVHRMAAMPCAVLAFLIVLFLSASAPSAVATPSLTGPLAQLEWVTPVFTLQSSISIAIPLFLVTMAGQNIPGFAVLETNGYPVDRPPLLRRTGFASLMTAPFGAVPVNMSAITAAMIVGEESGRDPAKRYWSAIACGIGYLIFALLTPVVAMMTSLAPIELVTTIAGLALIPALVGSLKQAFNAAEQLESPALTFLITASGMTLFGISGAFWGLAVGVIVWVAKQNFARKGR